MKPKVDRILTGLVAGWILCLFMAFPNRTIGAWQTLSGYAGWEVNYNFVYNGHTTDLYRYNGTNRFWYNQGPGQWFDRSAVNGAWSVLGPAGQSRTFIGDHNWRTFTDNKTFRLDTNSDWGIWRDNGVERFLYDYVRGQWCDHSAVNATWSCLGPDKQLSAFIGDHNWHTFADNRSYQYYTNNQWGVWTESGQYRFLYDYTTGQWKDRWNGNGTWSSLGPANQTSEYIGNHTWHDVGNGLSYRFWDNNSWGVWQTTAGTWTYRFRYEYSTGQWYHHTGTDPIWRKLGKAGNLTGILDGAYHALWSDGAKYQYLWDRGYWSSTGVSNDDDFHLDYLNGYVQRYSDGQTGYYHFVDYLGNRQYFLTHYIYWNADGTWSPTYTESSYGTDVRHTLWSDSTNSELLTYYLYTPGSDLRWSGGNLNVFLANNHVQPNNMGRSMLAFGQDTREDVITIEYDLEGGISLPTILTQLGYLVDNIYHKTIDVLAILAHGNTNYFQFGDTITTGNYRSYGTQWTVLNHLMTNKTGELQLYHCMTGSAATMLNDIAAWTNTRVFANVNDHYMEVNKLDNNYHWDVSYMWNYNYANSFFGAHGRYAYPQDANSKYMPTFGFTDKRFEYQSDSSGVSAYTMLFDIHDPYSQADMVWWWNNGNGRP